MTDIPFRVYGPQPLNGGLGEALYTAPTGTQKFFLRDLTFTNTSPTANDIRVRCTVGDIANPSKRVVDQLISIGSPTFLRPLWLIDAGETLQGIQIITVEPVMAVTAGLLNSAADATAYALAAWTPSANTMYVLVQINGALSGTTALNPSSITGNGSWTAINQTTSTVSAASNLGISAYWWFSSSAGSNATTTVNFASTQHSFIGAIYSVTNVYSGTSAAPPWTSTATAIAQSAVAADTALPGAGTTYPTVTLPSAIQTGLAFYAVGKITNLGSASTPPTGFASEPRDTSQVDGAASLLHEVTVVDPAPWTTSTTLGPSTFTGGSDNLARVAIGWEMLPGSLGSAAWVNCMVSGIEVH